MTKAKMEATEAKKKKKGETERFTGTGIPRQQ